MALIWTAVVLIVTSAAHGFFMDDPCDIYPSYFNLGTGQVTSETLIKVKVPFDCHNGTFDWDYPRGHVVVYFTNPKATPTTICLRDLTGGDAFNITDITGGRSYPILNIKRDHYTCSLQTTSEEIVLKVDAPSSLRYMRGFYYLVKQ